MNLFSVSKINIDNNNANSKQCEFPFVVGHAIKLLLHVISLSLSVSLSHSLSASPHRFCLTLRLFDIFVFCFAFYIFYHFCFTFISLLPFCFNSSLFAHNFSETCVRKQTNAWINTHWANDNEWMSVRVSEWVTEAEGDGWMRCLKNAKVKYKIQVHNQQKGQRDGHKERQTERRTGRQMMRAETGLTIPLRLPSILL